MPDIFNPPIPPQEGPSGLKRFVVNEIKFGEGYTSRFGDGLNANDQQWPLSWKGTTAEIEPIKDFFDAHNGYESFYWTPPMDTQKMFVVKEYTLVPEAAGNYTLNATLIQSYHP